MKHNKRNIITSEDVTLLGSNSGKTLDEVIENIQNSQDQLKSNVKWLYKYGGVGGSGKGSSDSSSNLSKWTAQVQLVTKDRIINIPEQPKNSTTYQTEMINNSKLIRVKINNPYGQEFQIKVRFGGTLIRSTSLNKRTGYLFEYEYDVSDNGILEIQIIDELYSDRPSYMINCIKNAYDFRSVFQYDGGRIINPNSLSTYTSYMSDLFVYRNIKYSLTADTVLPFSIKVVYTTLDLVTITENLESKKYDNEYVLDNINIIDNINNFLDDNGNMNYDKCGIYTFNIKIYIDENLVENTQFIFNLIPEKLYLGIRSLSDVILYQSQIDDPETSFVGNKPFSIIPYHGRQNTGDIIYCKIKIDNEWFNDGNPIVLNERESRTVSLPCYLYENSEQEESGWITLIFYACSDRNFAENQTEIFTYYVSLKKYSDNIPWYSFKSNAVLSQFSNFRLNERSTNYFQKTYDTVIDDNDNKVQDLIQMFSTDSRPMRIYTKSDYIDLNDISGHLEYIINIGIQYSDINNIDNEILKIVPNPMVDTDTKATIHIYQNKIALSSTDFGYTDETGNYSGFFIKRETEYDPNDQSKYQLITITKRYIREVDDNETYELDVYINGVLQACLPGFTIGSNKCTGFILNPGNYSINLLDIQCVFPKKTSTSESNNISNINLISDVDVVQYWYAYNIKIQQKYDNNDKQELLKTFRDYVQIEKDDNDLINGHVKISSSNFKAFYETLFKYLKVPAMCLEYNSSNYNGRSFMEWSDLPRTSDSNDEEEVAVGVLWRGENDVDFNEITFENQDPSGNSISVSFSVDIQGSTTRTYKSKNYTISLGDGNDEYIPVFTPIFDSNDPKKSFLPENKFTLKADVVDSSHTNNVCMANFINDISTRFEQSKQTGKPYYQYIKNCLQGFPFLLFVHDITKADKTGDYYYLGIYNFNLGRDSYFNLGYVDLNLLEGITIRNGFNVYFVNKDGYKSTLNGFVSGEIQKNLDWMDFSQYDESVLFKYDTDDIEYMFGDIVPKKENNSLEESAISSFVRKIMRAGGYIFDELGKGLIGYDDLDGFDNSLYSPDQRIGYRFMYGCVPQAKKQYRRRRTSTGNMIFEYDHEEPIFNFEDLYNCINVHGVDSDEIPACDYTSLVEYYTICMAFGLLDNVEKNLTIKSWTNTDDVNNKLFYFSFYDLDTCLGVNNKGGDVKYFAFSDSWEENSQLLNQIIQIDNKNTEVYLLDSVDIKRDYSKTGTDYYDAASSYAFAIAKYAKSFEATGNNSPQDLWALWRSNQNLQLQNIGCLSSADKFLQNYYIGYMKNLDELMFNYNYRAKYFLEEQKGTYNVELIRFKGNRINYVSDWLDKRFHILDAYFNLNKSTIFINDGYHIGVDKPAIYKESIYDRSQINFSNNDDVQIMKSILPQDQTYDPSYHIIIKAPDYTPLIVSYIEKTYRYLLNNNQNYYSIPIPGSGGASERITFYGSTLWTYLHDINFLSATCSLSSKYLENLYGDSGTIGSWSLNLPSLKKIRLTSQNYSGNLTINENFPNIQSIDISDSKINLNLRDSKIQSLNLSRIQSSSLLIQNCNQLNDIQGLSNVSISQTCSLELQQSFSFLNSNIKQLTVKGINSLTIQNDNTMTQLTASGFSTINIQNCESLDTVIQQNQNIASIYINNCQNLKNVVIYLGGGICESIQLIGCNIESLTFIIGSANDLTCFSSISKLNIDGSSFKNIVCRTEGSNENYFYSDTDGLLNLKYFTGLTSFIFQNNNNVKFIQFNNEINNPVTISDNKAFEGSNSIERIYGNIKLKTVSSLFMDKTNFSIHGNDAKWKGKNKVENGITQLPIKLINNNLDSVTLLDMFQEGDNVTNLQFKFDDNVNFSYFIYNTNCTQFDIYYILNVLGLSNVNKNVTLGTYSFYSNNKCFAFETGNQFDRYTFYKCSCITSISGESSDSGGYVFNVGNPNDDQNRRNTLFYSPTLNNETDSFNNDGLFSNLNNLKTLYSFSAANVYFDNNLFVLNTKLESIDRIELYQEYDDISECQKLSDVPLFITGSQLNYDYKNVVGNLSNFFDNTKIKTISRTLNLNILNFETLTIPNTITSIIRSFRITNGFGEFKWENVFNKNINYSNLTKIVTSFNLTNTIDSSGKIIVTLYNEMFNNMTNLEYLGSDNSTSSSNAGGHVTLTVDSIYTTTFSYNFFNGNGFQKVFKDSEFPYKITKNLSKLITFVGIFSDVSFSDKVITFPNYIDEESQQHSMFENNTKLTNIACLFCNANISITLNSYGFINNKSLSNVSRLFYINSSRASGYIKNIPSNFFSLGGTKASKEIYGSDDDEYNRVGTTKTFDYYKQDSRKINYARECFYGQNTIEAYNITGSINSLITNENLYLYVNPEYIPFKYYKTSETSTRWITTPEKNKIKYDVSYLYDGNPTNLRLIKDRICELDNSIDDTMIYCKDSENVELIPNNSNSVTINYFCPPDIFRYFINNSSLNVQGMFCWCGSGSKYSVHGDRGTSVTSSDISGRICPYLFSDISQVKNLIAFFKNCKGLSAYRVNDSYNCLIPRTLLSELVNLQYLCNTFSGLTFDNSYTDGFAFINRIHRNSSQVLDVRGIFSACNYQVTSQNTNFGDISNVFNGKYACYISGAFSNSPATITTNNNNPIVSVIVNNIPYGTSTSTVINFQNNFSFSNNVRNYNINNVTRLYYGYGSRCTINETNASLNSLINNASLNNK